MWTASISSKHTGNIEIICTMQNSIGMPRQLFQVQAATHLRLRMRCIISQQKASECHIL
jgi:hypothetical protein